MDRNSRVTTVQSMLEGALYKLYGNNPSVTVEGCSRTGRGVSAVYLIAHMFCPKSKSKRQQSKCESEEPSSTRTEGEKGDDAAEILIINDNQRHLTILTLSLYHLMEISKS
jgi:hypothetical protein